MANPYIDSIDINYSGASHTVDLTKPYILELCIIGIGIMCCLAYCEQLIPLTYQYHIYIYTRNRNALTTGLEPTPGACAMNELATT